MNHDELLEKVEALDYIISPWPSGDKAVYALRAVVELANKQLDTKDMPAIQVGWLHEGYNLAMDNILDAIEKELK